MSAVGEAVGDAHRPCHCAAPCPPRGAGSAPVCWSRTDAPGGAGAASSRVGVPVLLQLVGGVERRVLAVWVRLYPASPGE